MVTTHSTYFLNVQTPSGESAKAECTIPPAPGKPAVSGVKDNNDYRFLVNWRNDSLYKYFILILDAEGQYESITPIGTYRNHLRPSFLEHILFPSDAQILDNSYEAILQNAYLAENPVLKVSVRNIEEGLFKYFKSYQHYDDWDTNNSGNIFPNFQEMPLIYSNINGGVGIFGSYNESSMQLEL